MHGAELVVELGQHDAAGRVGGAEQPADERNRPARVGQLPPHQHHQAEAEEQEEEAGDRVLNADDFVIVREDVFPPEPELLMRVIVRMPVPVAMRFERRHLVHADSLPFQKPRTFLDSRVRLYAEGTSGASLPAGRKLEV